MDRQLSHRRNTQEGWTRTDGGRAAETADDEHRTESARVVVAVIGKKKQHV